MRSRRFLEQVRFALLALGTASLAACAAVTPAPRFSAVSPADPAGAESPVPPPAPALMGAAEGAAHEPGAPVPAAPGHEGHGQPAPPALEEAYACLMHPEVRSASPGVCPKCGMTLVKTPSRPQGGNR